MSAYDPKAIESKWQSLWAERAVFRVDAAETDKRPFYVLEMLPYPSGRIHMGHVRNYSIGDAVARFHRMRGRQVLHVIGWDAFGLPAENAAIQNHEEPRAWTLRNIDTMRAQLVRLGIGYDWTREIATCLPEYYRWNQWLFLRMLERGLAFRARRLLNWCASCGTVLANEQVHASRCWRCDNGRPPGVRAVVSQDHRLRAGLLDGLDSLPDWPERVRTMAIDQRSWRILSLPTADAAIEVFTTRPTRFTERPTSPSSISVAHEPRLGNPSRECRGGLCRRADRTPGRGPICGRPAARRVGRAMRSTCSAARRSDLGGQLRPARRRHGGDHERPRARRLGFAAATPPDPARYPPGGRRGRSQRGSGRRVHGRRHPPRLGVTTACRPRRASAWGTTPQPGFDRKR